MQELHNLRTTSKFSKSFCNRPECVQLCTGLLYEQVELNSRRIQVEVFYLSGFFIFIGLEEALKFHVCCLLKEEIGFRGYIGFV